MGWSSGSQIAQKLVDDIDRYVKDPAARFNIYCTIIEEFQGEDCDTLSEVQTDDREWWQACYENAGFDEEWWEDNMSLLGKEVRVDKYTGLNIIDA